MPGDASHAVAVAAIIITAGVATILLGGTNAGVWVLNRYARARGGEWHQARFPCPGCPSGRNQRHHIGRPGPTGTTLCLHCSPLPRGNQ